MVDLDDVFSINFRRKLSDCISWGVGGGGVNDIVVERTTRFGHIGAVCLGMF